VLGVGGPSRPRAVPRAAHRPRPPRRHKRSISPRSKCERDAWLRAFFGEHIWAERPQVEGEAACGTGACSVTTVGPRSPT
jgi:hypothetical protein